MNAITPSSNYAAYALSEIRCGVLRARLLANEMQSAAVALAGNLIDADEALRWISDAGGIGLICISTSWASS